MQTFLAPLQELEEYVSAKNACEKDTVLVEIG